MAREEGSKERMLLKQRRTKQRRTVGIDALRKDIDALRKDLDAISAYAEQLEAAYLRIVSSRIWRFTQPYRTVMWKVKALLRGQGVSAAPAVPARPKLRFNRFIDNSGISPLDGPREKEQQHLSSRVAETGASSTVAEKAGEIIDALRNADFPKLYALQRRFERALPTEEGFLLYHFLMVTLCRKLSSFGFGAVAAGAVLTRSVGKRDVLRRNLGTRAYRRFITDAAICMTRVGKYGDAKALLDSEISEHSYELLPLRAEVSWPHDPEQALKDLEQHFARMGREKPRMSDCLLYAHLSIDVLRVPARNSRYLSNEGQFHLVSANSALRDGRLDKYVESFNQFFLEQGLAAPLHHASLSARFAFESLGANVPASASCVNGPLVSVIMTTHNAEQTVAYAVRSILQQTYRNLELIIVDDCSSDNTLSVLRQLEREDGRIRILRNESNIGTYAAKNRGIEVAEGEFITCHDSDDWAHPQRIELHVNVMESAPQVVASRSNWIRVNPSGRIDFRRWQKRFVHPNPASLFFRKSNVSEIGYFDTVRFGADTEFWYRTLTFFGRDAVISMPQCLAVGRLQDGTLTRTGPGAMDQEHYSPVRSAYNYSWFEYYGRERSPFLEARPQSRKFWAPREMVEGDLPKGDRLISLGRLYPNPDNPVPNFVFGISLASKQTVNDWPRTVQLLRRTLLSLLNQTDPRFRVFICGHERPDLEELDDPRVTFMTADIAPPKRPSGFRKDKMWKRRLIGAALRDLGGGYFFPLDADDLVHKRLVEYVLSDNNERGYLIEQGYGEDFLSKRLAPIPGAWSASFDRVCGSCAALYFKKDELPSSGEDDPSLYFNLFKSHAYWRIVAEEAGRPLARIPFFGAVYVVNHSQNLSFGLQRTGGRVANIVASLERNALADGEEILERDFGQLEGG